MKGFRVDGGVVVTRNGLLYLHSTSGADNKSQHQNLPRACSYRPLTSFGAKVLIAACLPPRASILETRSIVLIKSAKPR